MFRVICQLCLFCLSILVVLGSRVYKAEFEITLGGTETQEHMNYITDGKHSAPAWQHTIVKESRQGHF